MSLLIEYEDNKISGFKIDGIECRDFLRALYKVWLHDDIEKEYIKELLGNACVLKFVGGAP